ncbi:MAG: trehalose-phosphatase [Actinomycetia bacterium]|nr:trehalose-phosphatase [Actinomycetes bacterium]
MTSNNLGELGDRLRQLARVPNLLIACDYDGTLAPLVDDPMDATPNRSAVAAMRAMAEQANTHVAVVSGRSLRDLALLSRFPEEIRLVGSHGSEFDLGFASKLTPRLATLRTELVAEVNELGARFGARIEEKPTGATFHFRGMDDDIHQVARDEIVRGPASRDGVFTRNGHDIIEMSVIDTNKGSALELIRAQVGASAVVFFGDDVTDEDGFRTLAGPDIGIRVGEGPTVAHYRVADTDVVAQLLALLSEFRTKWLRGAGLVPIEDHSMLSDQRTAAIVSPKARITWLCAPRVDSAAVFAELLGGPAAGHFSVSDIDGRDPIGQRYNQNTLVLETRFPDFRVYDYLDASGGRHRRLAGRSDLIRVIEGQGRATIEFAPRLDFGRVPTQLELRADGIVVMGTSDLMVLRAPGVDWEIVADGFHQSALATVELGSEPLVLELRAGTGTFRPDPRSETDRRVDTERFWSNWVGKLDLPELERELATRSAIMLKALCHGPTGAILAAATTGLPEHLGGVRNWDYRYCWLRDAALSATALARLNSHAEGMAYLDWVLHILETRSDPERLAPLYNVTGRHLPPEAEIADLPGYGGSRPVRVGNAADGQVQLDLFGPVVDLVHVLLERGEALSSEHWRLVEAMVLAVSHRWREPDHGIWEIRKPPRHHVYSKTMCWVTVDRAIKIADQFLDREPETWVELRDEIAADVLEHGWKPKIGSFTAAYHGDDLDASVLAVGLWGLLPPTDERFVSTVATLERELRTGPTVYRYLDDDGLPGREGGFNLMTSWLIDALTLMGRRADAESLFQELCGLVGATGIMAEQFDPENARALGNIPQAYSHLGLINNALGLSS